MSTPSNPGWATGYAPTAIEWAATWSGKADYPVVVGQGGTGLTANPDAGQLLIGTGTGFALAELTAGPGVTIESTPGGIELSATAASGAEAFTSYGLMWSFWFNATPVAGELLALYTSAISYTYPANFNGSYACSPLIPPAKPFTLTIGKAPQGGSYTTVGTISVDTSGHTTFVTTGGLAITVNPGDTLSVTGIDPADNAIAGYSVALKGVIIS